MASPNGNNSYPSLSGKTIIVAGGGIAGLAFVRGLHRTWQSIDAPPPHVTLYERRAQKISHDREGYSIGIRSDSRSGGMQALRKLGLLDEMLDAAIMKSEGTGKGAGTIWDKDFSPIAEFKYPNQPPDELPVFGIRILRAVLRKELIESLTADFCDARWGVGVEGAERLGDGRMKVVLSDGSTQECDLLVAADGAGSKVRAAVRPRDTLQYAGANVISATTEFPDGVPEVIKGTFGLVLSGDGNTMFVSPVDAKHAVWSLSRRENEPREALRGDQALVRKDEIMTEARSRIGVYTNQMEEFLDGTDPSTLTVFPAMDKMPIDHSELPSTPVVFLGDANHPMSPFAGNGANMALMDAVDLVDELCSSSNPDIYTARVHFDKKSMARSKATIKSSHMVIAVAHSQGWWHVFAKMFLRVLMFLLSRGW